MFDLGAEGMNKMFYAIPQAREVLNPGKDGPNYMMPAFTNKKKAVRYCKRLGLEPRNIVTFERIKKEIKE